MPELKWQWDHPLALAVIASVCGVIYWRFRKSGWLLSAGRIVPAPAPRSTAAHAADRRRASIVYPC